MEWTRQTPDRPGYYWFFGTWPNTGAGIDPDLRAIINVVVHPKGTPFAGELRMWEGAYPGISLADFLARGIWKYLFYGAFGVTIEATEAD